MRYKTPLSWIKKQYKHYVLAISIGLLFSIVYQVFLGDRGNYWVTTDIFVGSYIQKSPLSEINLHDGIYIADDNKIKSILGNTLSGAAEGQIFKQNCETNFNGYLYNSRSTKYMIVGSRGNDNIIFLKTVSSDLEDAMRCNQYLSAKILEALKELSEKKRRNIKTFQSLMNEINSPGDGMVKKITAYQLAYLDNHHSYPLRVYSHFVELNYYINLLLSWVLSALISGFFIYWYLQIKKN
jgi:hypothetical protein